MSDIRIGKKISDVFISQDPAFNPKQHGKITENDFEKILKKFGYIIGEKNNANELNVDQAIFLKDMSKFSNQSSFDVQNFVSGFESHLEDEIRLKWSLMPTVTAAVCETARNVTQDSLVHLLLNIDTIQEKVIELMISKLVEFSYCENNALYDRSEGKSVACLIVSQFRWLSRLVNSTALADKLLELIEGTPSSVQKDIIQLLPDVLNEFDHPKVAKQLGGIFLGNQNLNVIILDTLTNLNVDPALLSEIREKVIETMTTANVEDLPLLVKFVLQDLTAAEAPQVITHLRSTLDFNSTFNPIISSTPLEPKNKDLSKSAESSVLSTIRHALKLQKPLFDAWLKSLEALQGPSNHEPLDIFVILILLSLEVNKKKVESLIKNKVRAGDLNEDLVKVTFRCHHQVLQDYAPQLLEIAETFLRAVEPSISSFSCVVYVQCFVWFSSFYKQEVIGNLITHVGHKSETEINTAMGTLLTLVRDHPMKMMPFALFLKNLLDHLDDLTLNQIRKVHEMLSLLAYQGGREGSMLLDDILIVIRKQLTNKNLRYRKMGVIGALMAAKTVAEKESSEDGTNASFSPDLEECYQHSVRLLELVKASVSESPEAFSLFCDELSHILLDKKLGQTILNWIGESILSDFEETYIIDIKTEDYVNKDFSPQFALDEIEEPVAIDLYTIVAKDFKKNQLKISRTLDTGNSSKAKDKHALNRSKMLNTLLKASHTPIADTSKTASSMKLFPMFRLLRVYREIQDSNLDAIDAILGCSIVLPDLKQFSQFNMVSTTNKQMLINTLFACINWIRENINGFATVEEEEIRSNVISRLQLLVELEELVCKCVPEVGGGYIPPLANFELEEKELSGLKLFKSKKPVKRSVKASKKPKSKKRKTDDSIDQTSTNVQDSTSPKSDASDSESEVEPTIALDLKLKKALQPFFRELDINVFVLLESGITFQKRTEVLQVGNSNTSTKPTDSLQLHIKDFKYLLDDLSAKLQQSLGSTSTGFLKTLHKPVGFSNLQSYPPIKVASFCVQLIRPLVKIFRDFLVFFRNITQEADGVEDSMALLAVETQFAIVCLNLVLKVIKQIISWKNFHLKDNLPLLKQALSAFAPKPGKLSDNQSVDNLTSVCIEFLSQQSDALPSLSCAASFVQLLSSILGYSDHAESKAKTSSIALRCLKKNWFDLDPKRSKVADTNEHIKTILEAYLKNSNSVLKALDFLCAEAIPQLLDKEKEMVYSTLTKTSFGSYYRIMMANLATHLKAYFMAKHNTEDQMFEWSVAFKVFQVFTNLLKNFGNRSNIGACLKWSREVLQTFLRYGMPLMDAFFGDRREDVICLMKILQVSTRYLQHVCSHSKVTKDVTLLKHVPLLKKTLEEFVFRVKMLLAVHRCEDAFWLGNLKNRDLKGEEILSQEVNEDSQSENEEDETKSDTDLSNVESEDD